MRVCVCVQVGALGDSLRIFASYLLLGDIHGPSPIYITVLDAWFLDRPEIHYFGGLGVPGGRETPSTWRGASHPTVWKGSPGRRDRPDPKNRRFPVGPKAVHLKPPCIQSRSTMVGYEGDPQPWTLLAVRSGTEL